MPRMSHFATALNDLMEDAKPENLSQAELSRRSGIPGPQISRWINIPNQYVSDEDFQRLCRVFTKPSDQANLLRARLLDLISTVDVPGKSLVDIQIGQTAREESIPYITKLPPKIDRDVQTIIEHIAKDRLVRDMIASLAAHLRKKP